jgi:hypothetical protein
MRKGGNAKKAERRTSNKPGGSPTRANLVRACPSVPGRMSGFGQIPPGHMPSADEQPANRPRFVSPPRPATNFSTGFTEPSAPLHETANQRRRPRC